MSAFSTNETESLQKRIQLNRLAVKTDPCDIESAYKIKKCADWIKNNNYQKVCLQFPDYLLLDSSQVALRLQEVVGQTVYILADTAYESCCIDYISAAHVNADAIIHFGDVCFSKPSTSIPYLNVYEECELDINELQKCLNSFAEEEYTILIDAPYFAYTDDIKRIVADKKNVEVLQIDENDLPLNNKVVLFICVNTRKITIFKLHYLIKTLYYFASNVITEHVLDSKKLRKRFYFIEKIKDSDTIGIVIGTLAVQNYLKVIERMKKLISLSGKKYYLISVGKVTAAKLANFPEVDIFVLITCAMNESYEKEEFYKPVATPYDVEVALNANSKYLTFSYDYNSFITNADDDVEVNTEADVSLLSGGIRKNKTDDEKLSESHDLMERGKGVLANVSHGAGFLANRSWRGLEQNLGETEVKLAEEGRSGIAQGYKNESDK